MKNRVLLLLSILSFVSFSCQKDKPLNEATNDPAIPIVNDNTKYGKITLNFENKAGEQSLVLNNQTYINANLDSFTVSKFKYYISNISFVKADGSVFKEWESYYLFDQQNGSLNTLVIDSVPLGEYTKINFLLGVDSARNTAGAQSGALDPTNGMFWDWNSGYIFLMFEGNSPQSTLFNNTLMFHLGGFTRPYNCIRSINPSFNGGSVVIKEQSESTVNITTDVLKMFDAPGKIKFAQTNEAMGGATGVVIANNAAQMFSVTSIIN